MAHFLSNRELASFSGELAMILHSGISVLEGVSILAEDGASEEERLLLTKVYESLEMNGDLALALRESGVFPEYFLKMTELGDRSGTLEEVMELLSSYYNRQHTLLTGIRDALTYPLILLGMLLAVLLVLMTQVMPVFEDVFEQLGIETGALTDTVFLIGSVMQKSAVVVLLLVAAFVLFCFSALRTGKGRTRLVAWIQKIPFGAAIHKQMACSAFANALSIALHSGLDINEGFELARGLTDQQQFLDALSTAAKQIEEGNDFAESLKQAEIFSGTDARMVSIGFRTGSAETALQRISVNCQEDADRRIQNAVGMLEPVLTAVLSVLTGVILVSVMLPLLSVMTNIG